MANNNANDPKVPEDKRIYFDRTTGRTTGGARIPKYRPPVPEQAREEAPKEKGE